MQPREARRESGLTARSTVVLRSTKLPSMAVATSGQRATVAGSVIRRTSWSFSGVSLESYRVPEG